MNKKLTTLYNKTSKHSQYQVLAEPIKKHIEPEILDIHSRYERERLEYFLKNIDFKNQSISDVGANTGFFSIEAIGLGAKSAQLIEGNKTHCDFLNESISVLNWTNKAQVFPQYMDFDSNTPEINSNITLLLNVLHHVGDDYDNNTRSTESAKYKIIESLKKLSFHTETLIFQLGFNWKGDRNLSLFKNGTKQEMIDFIQESTNGYWDIQNIGVAEKNNEDVKYYDVNDQNIHRDDLLGEFLNRPIFIMKSKSLKTLNNDQSN